MSNSTHCTIFRVLLRILLLINLNYFKVFYPHPHTCPYMCLENCWNSGRWLNQLFIWSRTIISTSPNMPQEDQPASAATQVWLPQRPSGTAFSKSLGTPMFRWISRSQALSQVYRDGQCGFLASIWSLDERQNCVWLKWLTGLWLKVPTHPCLKNTEFQIAELFLVVFVSYNGNVHQHTT